MKRLEDELQNLLRRRDPPAGFAGRLLRKIAAEERQSGWHGLRHFFRSPAFHWLAASLAGALLVIGLALYQRQQRRIEARKDSQQALLALRITGQKLNEALARAANVGRHPGEIEKSDLSEEEP
jgi:hypothetical protein